MRLSKFCKKQGMDLEQYRAYKEFLQEKAQKIYDKMLLEHKQGTGLYLSLSDYIDTDMQESLFVLEFLKELDVEIFYETMEFRIL